MNRFDSDSCSSSRSSCAAPPPRRFRSCPSSSAHADDDGHDRNRRGGGAAHELLEELHESLSNLFIFAVILHASYLILFRRPLAFFMLFRDVRRR